MTTTQTLSVDASVDMNPAELLSTLEQAIRPYDDLLVAFSGGVDSGVLLAAATRVLGSRAIGLIADSPSLPRRELTAAIRFARQIDATLEVVSTNELDREAYSRNDSDRCFFCKESLFEACERIAADKGIRHVAYGFTADDVGDYRPGQRAAENFGVARPLFDAGLGKAEIRAIARHLDLDLWDKPAAPCLSSRIPYGSEVTLAKLDQIEKMEDLLVELGFAVFRARFDGNLMRIELEPADIPRAVSSPAREAILARAKTLGVPFVTIDLEGFASGKLNRSLR